MANCWLAEPSARPTFSTIITLLNDILHPRAKCHSQEDEGEEDEEEEDEEGRSANYVNLHTNVDPAET